MTTKETFLIIVGMLCLTLFLACGSEKEKILPEKTTITESVYSSVIIQPDSLYQAYVAVAGILDKNLVEAGDEITNGAPISQIINNTNRLNTDNAKLALELAQENYNGSSGILVALKDEIHAATLSFQNDSVNFLRQKRLWDQQIGSKVEFDTRKLAYELSRNNLSLLKSSYKRTKNELQTQVHQARNSFKSSQINTKDFTVTSKIDGKVYALYKEPGESVTTMEPLASIGSTDVFLIELLVDEVDIVKVKLHQKVLLTLDAYQNEVFEAKVSKIYPRKNERSQTFEVEAVFDNPPEVLYPGLSGEGNIIIAKQNDALVIPKSYLIEGSKVNTENGLIEVKLGLQSLDKVEITEGIDHSDYILKPDE